MNPRAEAALASGLGSRPSLGYPGDKYEMGLEAIEKIEVIAAELAAEIFNARYAEIRVGSGALANLYAFMATCAPGDRIIVPPPAIGGHVTHQQPGAAGLYGLEIHMAPVDADGYTVDVEKLRDMAKAGIEIGAHTRTHADLGGIQDEGRLFSEIVGGADELAELIEKPIRYFAFPYGQWSNLNPRAFQIAREAGFAGVCSAYGGYNFPGEDAFHLQRIHGDPELVRLKNWLTVDPRKLHTPRYEYTERRAAERVAGAAP